MSNLARADEPELGPVESRPGGSLRIDPLPEPSGVRPSLIIPTYNEAKNVAELVQRLTVLLDGNIGENYELISAKKQILIDFR
jgi:dolichol-phosphate mannosyltransferase